MQPCSIATRPFSANAVPESFRPPEQTLVPSDTHDGAFSAVLKLT